MIARAKDSGLEWQFCTTIFKGCKAFALCAVSAQLVRKKHAGQSTCPFPFGFSPANVLSPLPMPDSPAFLARFLLTQHLQQLLTAHATIEEAHLENAVMLSRMRPSLWHQGRKGHGDVPGRSAGVAPSQDRREQSEAHSDPGEVTTSRPEGMPQWSTPFPPPAFDNASIMRRSENKASRTMRMKAAPSAKRAPASPTSKMRPAVASVLAEPSPNGQPVSKETIRLCAYRKWETAGKPGGDGINFWLEAERELSQAK